MDASLLIGITGSITGAIGVGLAFLADKRAKEANRIAQSASRHSKEANRLAEEANKLASDANAVSHRALRVSAENIDYTWELDIQNETGFTIRNQSAVEALNLTATVKDESGSECVVRIDHVAAVRETHFDSQGLLQKHFEQVRGARPLNPLAISEEVSAHQRRIPVTSTFKFFLKWETPAGQDRTGVADLTLCHCVADEDGAIRRLDYRPLQ